MAETDGIRNLLRELQENAPSGQLDAMVDEEESLELLWPLVEKLSVSVIDGAELDSLIGAIAEEYRGSVFWDCVRQMTLDRLEPFLETAFIRELDFDHQRAFLSDVFENMIRYQEPWPYLQEFLQTDAARLEACYKMFNTLIDWVLYKRYSKRRFTIKCREFFGFESDVTEFLWELLCENRTMLIERAMLKDISQVTRFFDQMSQFMETLEDEETLLECEEL